MRNIQEILTIIRDEFISETLIFNDYSGLCYCISTLKKNGVITFDEFKLIDNYFKKYTNTRKVFYTWIRDEIFKTDNSYNTYTWLPHNKTPRLNWLNKHIKNPNELWLK